MRIQARGMHAQPVQVIIGQFMADHFHSCIPVMPGQLSSTYENKEAAIFFNDLLAYNCTEFFHGLGINAPGWTDESASQLDNVSIAICVGHLRRVSFSKVNASKNIITPRHHFKAAMPRL